MTDVSNRTLALQAFEQFAAGNTDFLKTVIHQDFVEHSPGNPSGRDAFIAFLAASPAATSKLTLARVIAGDNHVVMHYRMDTPGEPPSVVVDLWRFENGQIVEHWDVVQPLPTPAATPNGML